MKALLRKLFTPVINHFESGNNEYTYQPSHRKILIALGALFLLLAFGSLYASIISTKMAGILPAIVFLLVGGVCEIVGFFGSDRAVANIWKRK
ncbi:hypothetical protein [Porticoccus sp.]